MRTPFNLHSNWTFLEPKSKKHLVAQVPGCIHADLRRHKLIPDPFWGTNESQLQWIEEKDWTYRCEFTPEHSFFTHEHIDLVAEGLDTLATIRLNGKEIARTEDMFIGYRFDVQKKLCIGKNVLEIKFSNPMDYIRARMKPEHYKEWCDPVGGSSLIRKEPCSFGWDWGPRFATCGIWLPIRLEGWSSNRIVSVRLEQKHKKDEVEIIVHTALATNEPAYIQGKISFNGKKISDIQKNRVTVSKPKLWWPNGHGEQPLYELSIELLGENGKILDTWVKKIGLRTIELDRHPDEFGESFQFVVNGRPVFAKGANWIPAHAFVTEANRDLYDNLLSSAKEANMNMLRLWGGGIYEKEDFYDLCDEKGIMVWHDFMFACTLYPGDDAFLELVRKEVAYQIPRIAHRACLALWCGNNEIEQMPQEIIKTPERKKAYEDIFYKILPEAVETFDGTTPYWPCSPHNPEGYEKGHNNERAGDCHFWDVWHARYPVRRYEEMKFRFCSEFGMQSYSSPEVAATFCKPENFNVFAPAMECHQKNGAGNQIILDYISRRYRFPKDYASLAYLSQLNQAYCMKFGIEHFRRSMPRTMGALYWQLNDCWPVFSWSSIEFGGRWKALQFAAKRFFAPLLVSAHIPGEEKVTHNASNTILNTVREVHLYSVYDGLGKTPAKLAWTVYHLDGRKITRGEKPVQLKYGESKLQKTLDLKKEIEKFGTRNIYIHIRLKTSKGEISEDTVFLSAPRLMDLPKAAVKTSVKKVSDQEFELAFTSPVFQHQVQFSVKGIAFKSEDNFFDLYPGGIHKVRITTAKPCTASRIKDLLSTTSLVNSY